MKRMFNKIAVAALIIVFYTAFTGQATELTIITGLAASVAIAVILEPLLIKRELKVSDVVRLLYFLKYALHFAALELREHFEIAKVVFKRRISVEPQIVKIPIDLESDYSIALLASTITNTPGTIVLHVDRDRRILYVHWLMPKTKDVWEAKKLIVGGFENVIRRVLE